MALLGMLIKSAYALKDRASRKEPRPDSMLLQIQTLEKLLTKAKDTAFGKHYDFGKMLNTNMIGAFQETVPVFDYNKMFKEWWQQSLQGEANISWPGKVKYFALTSGTSEASSKQIPITSDMLSSIKKASIKQLASASRYDFPTDFFEKGILMIGGSTQLEKSGPYKEGDLSGISAGNIPFWFQHFYKPGKRIAQEKDWKVKLDEIVKSAPKWDIGIIVGVPAWVQIMLERIIETYNLNTIHDIWPNLNAYVHSGVSFAPYRKSFSKLFSHPIMYNESYLASEGYIAYQDSYEREGMRLNLDNGIFFEFVPFTSQNFDEDGNIKDNPECYHIGQVKENEEYALLLSTNAGAWRYIIGDTIRFTSVAKAEIIITGRTKHFLSICGEHLSLDNISRAVELLNEEMKIDVREFTVMGVKHGSMWAHQWYLALDNAPCSEDELAKKLDSYLCELNDDYRVERMEAIKDVNVKALPTSVFARWMEIHKKEGGANKFPRVLKGNIQEQWTKYLNEQGF